MYREFSVPVSYAGGISMIIAVGTIISSLLSDRLTKRFGAGKITAVSVFMTAAALFGFSTSHTFIALCLWAVPYGLGAGCVDAALNNYVALHYTSRHMSWLHCMWGVGCSTGPVVMGYAINHSTWNNGYRTIALFQIVLTLILFFSLPLWQKPSADASADETSVPEQRSFSRLIRFPVSKSSDLLLLLLRGRIYCRHVGCKLLYFVPRHRCKACGKLGKPVLHWHHDRRFFCGFITMKLNDQKMIRLGQADHRNRHDSDAAAAWRFPSVYRPDPDRTWLCADLSFHHSRDTGKLRC